MRAAKVLLTIRTSPRLDCLNSRPLKLDLAGGGSTCAASCLETATQPLSLDTSLLQSAHCTFVSKSRRQSIEKRIKRDRSLLA